MADQRISDMADGTSLQVTDLILVLRNNKAIGESSAVTKTNVHLRGALLAAGIDYRPPNPTFFTDTLAALGATAGLSFSQASRGTMASAPNEAGIKLGLRNIPSQSLGQFSMVTRVDYSGVGLAGSIFGPAVATADGAVFGFVGRGWKIGSLAMHGPTGGVVRNGSLALFPYDMGSECTWFRVTVSGTTATFECSDNGVVWITLGSQDFGAPITRYGYGLRDAGNGASPGRVSYFDSSEFPNDRF
jgi:hypothetical protein